MEEQLLGTTLPVLSIALNPGETVVAEAGEFSWMTDSIQMSTGMGGGTGGQGLVGALKRAAGGSTVFLSSYTATDSAGIIAFAAKLPGSILGIDVGAAQEYLVHRHGFLAGTAGIEISAGFQQSFSAGIFGGEGFVLQRVAGQGRAWIELAGEVVRYDLAAGQSLRAHPGHVGMFTASVKGGGTHSVTVPAGTYQATVVDQTMAETVLGHPVNIVVRTWLAPGVGPVKSEVLSKASATSAMNITEVLKSFTN